MSYAVSVALFVSLMSVPYTYCAWAVLIVMVALLVRVVGSVEIRCSVAVAVVARFWCSLLFFCLVVCMWYPRLLKCLSLLPVGRMSRCCFCLGVVVQYVLLGKLIFWPTMVSYSIVVCIAASNCSMLSVVVYILASSM